MLPPQLKTLKGLRIQMMRCSSLMKILSAAVATLPPQQDVVASEPADDVGIEAPTTTVKSLAPYRWVPNCSMCTSVRPRNGRAAWSQSLEAWVPSHAVQPVPESAAAMAHSLAGASAAVGFTTLSVLARALVMH